MNALLWIYVSREERDENSNGLCSCGLPRSEALRVASTLATARGCDFLESDPLSCIQEVHISPTSEDPCQACTGLYSRQDRIDLPHTLVRVLVIEYTYNISRKAQIHQICPSG
jgi:hypothetical protein